MYALSHGPAITFGFKVLGFWYFKFLISYERISNRIRIQIFAIFILALEKSSYCSTSSLIIVYSKQKVMRAKIEYVRHIPWHTCTLFIL